MKKDHNGLIGFLIIIAFIIVITGIFFVLLFGRYILLILGILFLITTIALNQKYEKEKKTKSPRENIIPIKPIEGNHKSAQSMYKDIFTALYDINGNIVAQDIQLPNNDFFLYSGYPSGTYFFRTIGMDKKGKWIILNCQVIVYEYTKPIKIITEEQFYNINK